MEEFFGVSCLGGGFLSSSASAWFSVLLSRDKLELTGCSLLVQRFSNVCMSHLFVFAVLIILDNGKDYANFIVSVCMRAWVCGACLCVAVCVWLRTK